MPASSVSEAYLSDINIKDRYFDIWPFFNAGI
jgi:hypothetical protein